MPDGSRSFAPTPDPALERVAALFREHFDFVARVLRRCGVPEAEVDDAVQETFLVVHRKIGDFEGRASERTWLYAVAVRVASTLRRSARREQVRRDKAGTDVHASSDASPELELARTEAASVLHAILDELDQSKRVVFVLAELEGVEAREIARILDVNVRTVHSRLRLARERFTAALNRHHAREDGAVRRAAMRAVLREPPRTPAPSSRVRAAWGALAVRIGDGALPMPFIWKGAITTTAAATSSFVLPFAVTVGLGTAGLAVLGFSETDARTPTMPSPSAREPTGAPAPAPAPATPAAAAIGSRDARVEPTPEPELHRETTTVPPTPATPSREPTMRPTPNPSRHADDRAPTVDPSAALAAETKLIERARRAVVAGNTALALELLDTHARQFPRGVFASERDSTRVKTLCSAGRNEAARAFVAHRRASLKDVLTAHCED